MILQFFKKHIRGKYIKRKMMIMEVVPVPKHHSMKACEAWR